MSYLTVDEIAEHYRTTCNTVRYWRHVNYGPKPVKVGRKLLYPADEVQRFDEQLRACQASGGDAA